MSSTSQRLVHRLRRKKHVRKHLAGTAQRPRLVVFRSNKHIYAQVIDDDAGATLAAASDLSASVRGTEGDKKAVAKAVGKALGEAATAAGVSAVAFDRNGFKYHGRLAALADGAREAGLKF